MSREKLIEEMAKDLEETYNYEGCDAWHCGGCKYEKYKGNHLCESIMQAEKMTNKGYRKQSEWISVEERLPESGVHCLLCCDIKRIDGTHRQYVCDGYYAERWKEECCNVDDDAAIEYNEENDEYYLLEGWYEVIKNWDDYSSIAIDDTVTHWMPLPEAPKMTRKEDEGK